MKKILTIIFALLGLCAIGASVISTEIGNLHDYHNVVTNVDLTGIAMNADIEAATNALMTADGMTETPPFKYTGYMHNGIKWQFNGQANHSSTANRLVNKGLGGVINASLNFAIVQESEGTIYTSPNRLKFSGAPANEQNENIVAYLSDFSTNNTSLVDTVTNATNQAFDTLETKVDDAKSTATNALDKAETAKKAADEAMLNAGTANNKADYALRVANGAQVTANSANTKADSLRTDLGTVGTVATNALNKANAAQNTANTANNNATEANTKATEAKTLASAAVSMISETNETFSTAVLAVGLNIDTNSVATLNEIADTFGGFPIEGTATTVGGLLAALAAAVAWLKKNKVGSFDSVGGATATVDNGVAKLDNFFTNSNSLLTGTIDARLPYQFYDVTQGGFLKDRAINMVTASIDTVIVPESATDLIIRASVSSSLAVAFHDSITTKYGDTFPSEAGEYLITITKIGASEVYVRTIKLEVAQ